MRLLIEKDTKVILCIADDDSTITPTEGGVMVGEVFHPTVPADYILVTADEVSATEVPSDLRPAFYMFKDGAFAKNVEYIKHYETAFKPIRRGAR